jgi:hypothetical protein
MCLIVVIGVVGADLSNVVANMFATSNVSKEFQSISVAIVVTMLSMSQTIGQSIASALITSTPFYYGTDGRYWGKCIERKCSGRSTGKRFPCVILVRIRMFDCGCSSLDDVENWNEGT